jgi:tetratricopeptide (TPR) repeat protein
VYRERRTVDILEHGLSYLALGRFSEAEERLNSALGEQEALLAQQGDTPNKPLLDYQGDTTYWLGVVHYRMGDLRGAAEHFTHSLGIRRELTAGHLLVEDNDRKARWTSQLNQSRDGLAQIFWFQGRLVEAARLWEDLITSQRHLVMWREREHRLKHADTVRLINETTHQPGDSRRGALLESAHVDGVSQTPNRSGPGGTRQSGVRRGPFLFEDNAGQCLLGPGEGALET